VRHNGSNRGARLGVSAATTDVLLARLPAVQSSVTRGRHMLADYLDRAGIADPYDICLATTEALSNVVRHAYGDDDRGDVELEASIAGGALHITVRDFGLGPRAHLASEGLGLGLALMASLARHVVIDVETGRGTEVRLEFAV
jgi:anti-sigma regulatory factor (Ser/Thr protein kinase)